MTSAVVEPRNALPSDVEALYPWVPRLVELGNGVRMAVVDEGPRDAEAVVLLHGNPVWGFLWRHAVRPLLDAGFRVVVPDHVGFGRSWKPRDVAYHSLERHVENLATALDALAVRDATLVVHDWGGPIGLGWAVRHPARVRRLVVMNTTVFPPKKARPLTAWHSFFSSPFGTPLGRNLNLVLESALRFGVRRHEVMRGAVGRAYRWPFPTGATRAGPLGLLRMVPDSPDHPTIPALRVIDDGLAQLAETPALLVWAMRDPVFSPRMAERWRSRLPGVRRVEHVQDAGHFLQEDAPEEVVDRLLRFLQESE